MPIQAPNIVAQLQHRNLRVRMLRVRTQPAPAIAIAIGGAGSAAGDFLARLEFFVGGHSGDCRLELAELAAGGVAFVFATAVGS
ncbi:hypothetical protein BDDG_11916 [Blastomyces dermatitidis ATCC 18188]|uniref:Uncharacterized protein n=1 Tax=Ajellomyces dermatitidis (strain ATCC 18188 / CBS 674.68) TaxID=653446 RepID=A0A0J9ELC8_AJEDA|nr:hypothetical protein BDDG_11916 [Blastomyces dermatitidis ATCC 18188]